MSKTQAATTIGTTSLARFLLSTTTNPILTSYWNTTRLQVTQAQPTLHRSTSPFLLTTPITPRPRLLPLRTLMPSAPFTSTRLKSSTASNSNPRQAHSERHRPPKRTHSLVSTNSDTNNRPSSPRPSPYQATLARHTRGWSSTPNYEPTSSSSSSTYQRDVDSDVEMAAGGGTDSWRSGGEGLGPATPAFPSSNGSYTNGRAPANGFNNGSNKTSASRKQRGGGGGGYGGGYGGPSSAGPSNNGRGAATAPVKGRKGKGGK